MIKIGLLFLLLLALVIVGPAFGAGIGDGARYGLIAVGIGIGLAVVILAIGWAVSEYHYRQWQALIALVEADNQRRALDIQAWQQMQPPRHEAAPVLDAYPLTIAPVVRYAIAED